MTSSRDTRAFECRSRHPRAMRKRQKACQRACGTRTPQKSKYRRIRDDRRARTSGLSQVSSGIPEAPSRSRGALVRWRMTPGRADAVPEVAPSRLSDQIAANNPAYRQAPIPRCLANARVSARRIAVSDRAPLAGLTHATCALRSSRESCEGTGVCDNLSETARNSLILKRRDVRVVGSPHNIRTARRRPDTL